LHDTVLVIKELYASVLERTTSGAGAASTGGKPSRPLELDLRTPTGVAAPTASPPTPARPDPLERAEKRVGGDRLTELPTAFALDEDVSFEDAAVPEVVLTDLIERGGSDSVPTRRHGPGVADPAGAHRAVDGVSIDSGARAAGATPPIAAAARPDAAARGAGSDDSLTQAPTEALIDIDVGPTTGLSDVMGQTKPKQGAGRNK